MIGKALIRVVLVAAAFAYSANADARKLDVSDAVPAFSAIDVAGSPFSYPSDANEVLLIATRQHLKKYAFL